VLVSDVHFGRGQLDSLIETLLQIPGLAHRDTRDARVDELRTTLRRPFEPARSDDPRTDLTAVVHACSACSGGLRTLARIIGGRHPGEASARLVARIDDVVGPVLLSTPDRDALRDILTEISVMDIADAVVVLGDVPELSSLRIWRDVPAAIRAMERLPIPDVGAAPLIAFVERLAEIEVGPDADRLRDWLDMVAGGVTVENAAATARRVLRTMPLRPLPASTPPRPRRAEEAGLIWSGVPIRNRNFTGRAALLDRLASALGSGVTTSVLPQTLQGLGGVGKTQLVIEFVYRHLDQYDLVWWIPAEQTATVLTSLTQLADRLELPIAEDRQETARTVLDWLAGSDLRWLLVYDNADDPSTLGQLLPSTGGHVIVTTRIQEWSKVGVSIEVDVFKREESVELLTNRSRDDQNGIRITPDEADELADKLGDLPLALEQAAAWYLATAMPIREYIDLLDNHIKELLDEGKPANYPLTVAAFVALALEKLRETAEAAAQLFALFAYLGGEPIRQSLLRYGSSAEGLTEPLRGVLLSPIQTSRTLRDLSRFGLAKVDPTQRVQVHRLVQRVLRDTLNAEQRAETLRNAQNLLAAANPGDPDDIGEWERQREMGPHMEPADMIRARNPEARQAVIHHARYLYLSGDYENSRYLSRLAADAWQQEDWDIRLGPDGEFTLLAWAQVANATRTLGDSRSAATIINQTYPRFLASPELGPEHEFTLITGNQVGADLRIAGRYSEALEFDSDNVTRHVDVFGQRQTYTLRAQGNLAVDYRLIGRFAEALAVDSEIADHWEDAGGIRARAILSYTNIARDYYGLGAYNAAIEVLERWRGAQTNLLGPGHSQVLLAERTYAIALRKAGRLDEATDVMRENHQRTLARFGPNHEYSVAATMSYANLLRQANDPIEALVKVSEALERYRADFSDDHPLTLVAQVNEAIARRAAGEFDTARALSEHCFQDLARALNPDHPYTICAGTSLATDYAVAGRHDEARNLSETMVARSRASYAGGEFARDGAEHPYLLARAINLSYDMKTTGDAEQAERLYRDSLDGMRRALGADHPEVRAAQRRERLEGDIEPPPT
jgi:tetratricopeptide (TPR) repeat protein